MNNIIATTLCAGLFAGSAQAAEEIYITGATAFRANANAALTALFAEGANALVQKDNADANKANKRTWSGTVQGTAVVVYESYSGSAAGVGSVAAQTPISFLTVAGVASSHQAHFAFSDVFQASTDFQTPALVDSTVGVQPFLFCRGFNSDGSLSNMTHNLAKLFLANGVLPLGHLAGNPALANAKTNVYLLGRDSGSGTRLTIHAETDYGISVGANLAKANDVTTVTNMTVYPSPNTGGTDGGYASGGDVAKALKNAPATLPCLGYMGMGDALAQSLYPGKELTYNGVPFTPDNVKNGTYTLWSYEHFFHRDDLTGYPVDTFKKAFIKEIEITLDGIKGIKVSDMKVERSGDGQPVYQLW